MESFLTIETWQWWVFGVLLIISEALIPQMFLMWVGLAAVFTGSVIYVKPELGIFTAVLIFIFLSSIASSIAARLGYKVASPVAKGGVAKKNRPQKQVTPIKETSKKTAKKILIKKPLSITQPSKLQQKTKKKSPKNLKKS